jgi:hypothetical protein
MKRVFTHTRESRISLKQYLLQEVKEILCLVNELHQKGPFV